MFACIPKLLDFSKPRAGGEQVDAQACGAAGFAIVSLPTERCCEDLRREEGESALGNGVTTPNLCGDVANLRRANVADRGCTQGELGRMTFASGRAKVS